MKTSTPIGDGPMTVIKIYRFEEKVMEVSDADEFTYIIRTKIESHV